MEKLTVLRKWVGGEKVGHLLVLIKNLSDAFAYSDYSAEKKSARVGQCRIAKVVRSLACIQVLLI
jgi:hypothetical protein